MRFPHFFAVFGLTTVAFACSSDSKGGSTAPAGETGGTSAGGSSNGGSATGGSPSGGSSNGGSGGTTGGGGHKPGTGGADPADCQVDSGADECRLCLASHCCDSFKDCEADAACSAAFDEYQTCVHGANGDGNVVSQCYSTFAGAIGSTKATFNKCNFDNCTVECGGPLFL